MLKKWKMREITPVLEAKQSLRYYPHEVCYEKGLYKMFKFKNIPVCIVNRLTDEVVFTLNPQKNDYIGIRAFHDLFSVVNLYKEYFAQKIAA